MYPITRVKKPGTKRFVRGIKTNNTINQKTYSLNDKSDVLTIFNVLNNDLMKIFDVDNQTVRPILTEYLNVFKKNNKI